MPNTQLEEKIDVDSLHFFGAVQTQDLLPLTRSADFVDHVHRVISGVGATCLGFLKHDFAESPEEQSGFTAVFLLAESHVAVHTWPEFGVAEVDVYLCNYLRDNRRKCEELFDGITVYFNPLSIDKHAVRRPRVERLAVHAT